MKIWDADLIAAFESHGREAMRSSAVARDRSAEFTRAIWDGVGQKSLFSMGRAGDGLNLPALASAFYGLAKGSLDVPLVCTFAAHGVIARDLLLRYGSTAQKEKYLAGLESGRLRAAICNSEPGAGVDMRNMSSECLIDESSATTGHLKFEKPCVTNGSGSSLYLVSAWERRPGCEPEIGVYLVEEHEVETRNLAPELSAFRTGLTGSVRGEVRKFPFAERRLRGNAFEMFRRCFHLERLFIGIITAGTLMGLEREAILTLESRASKIGKSVGQQWLHEKLVRVATVRIKLSALAERILTADGIESCAPELSVLKIMVNDEALDAAMAFFELTGHQAVLSEHIAQKLLRDLLAFKFFGGTTELQKMSLYSELMPVGGGVAKMKKAG